MTLSRRSLIGSLISLVAAPAIVRAGSLMPVKAMDVGLTLDGVPIEFDAVFEWSPYYTLVPVHGWGPPQIYKSSPLMTTILEEHARYAGKCEKA